MTADSSITEHTILGVVNKGPIDVEANLMLVLVLGKARPWLLPRVLLRAS